MVVVAAGSKRCDSYSSLHFENYKDDNAKAEKENIATYLHYVKWMW